MRVGGSFNLPQLPQQLPQRQPVAPTTASHDPSSSDVKNSGATATPSTALVDLAAEFVKARASQSTGQSAGADSFYSIDRNLSLKGQAAMETYATNSGFQFGSSQAEWVGVDTYA